MPLSDRVHQHAARKATWWNIQRKKIRRYGAECNLLLGVLLLFISNSKAPFCSISAHLWNDQIINWSVYFWLSVKMFTHLCRKRGGREWLKYRPRWRRESPGMQATDFRRSETESRRESAQILQPSTLCFFPVGNKPDWNHSGIPGPAEKTNTNK